MLRRGGELSECTPSEAVGSGSSLIARRAAAADSSQASVKQQTMDLHAVTSF